MQLQRTRNDLTELTRSIVPGLLDSRLQDCIDLQAQTRQERCHVKGPYFSGMLRLFGDINEEAKYNLDTIAERAAHLWGDARRGDPGRGVEVFPARTTSVCRVGPRPGRHVGRKPRFVPQECPASHPSGERRRRRRHGPRPCPGLSRYRQVALDGASLQPGGLTAPLPEPHVLHSRSMKPKVRLTSQTVGARCDTFRP